MLSLDIVVSSSDTTTLKLSGSSRKVVGLNELQKYGIRIAGNLAITADNCLKYLDSARVEIDPPLSSEESLVNPGPLLDVLNLRKDNLPDGKGLIIRGLATLDEYTMVLREIVFVHLGLEKLRNPSTVVYHNFKVLNVSYCYFCVHVLVWLLAQGLCWFDFLIHRFHFGRKHNTVSMGRVRVSINHNRFEDFGLSLLSNSLMSSANRLWKP